MLFEIRSPARLHMSLIDLNGSLGRIDGGYGITLNEPAFKIEFNDECTSGVHYQGPEEYTELVHQIYHKIQQTYEVKLPQITITVHDIIPIHQGLGSKTQFCLTIAKGITLIAHLSIPIEELTRLINRGGTSGIGFRTFDLGGFILDGGHSFGKGQEKEQFLPSSASPAPPSPLLVHYPVPSDWRIILIHLNVQQGANSTEEINMFQTHCPTPQEDVLNISHRILMQILPGMVTGNLDAIGQAQRYINSHGFKRVEISLQHQYVSELISWLQDQYLYPVGMSSFGPTIFLIVPTELIAVECLEKIKEKINNDPISPKGNVIITKPNNSGAEIHYIE